MKNLEIVNDHSMLDISQLVNDKVEIEMSRSVNEYYESVFMLLSKDDMKKIIKFLSNQLKK